jgi:hypothetical protein
MTDSGGVGQAKPYRGLTRIDADQKRRRESRAHRQVIAETYANLG